jgi:hypothetical protein
MCLTLRSNYTEPYNANKTRWKVVKVHPFTKDYIATHTKITYLDNQWMTAVHNNRCYGSRSYDIGFHTFVTREDARKFTRQFRYTTSFKIISVQVDKFIASGTYEDYRCETWKKMKVAKQ